jgi:hypothetical protein
MRVPFKRGETPFFGVSWGFRPPRGHAPLAETYFVDGEESKLFVDGRDVLLQDVGFLASISLARSVPVLVVRCTRCFDKLPQISGMGSIIGISTSNGNWPKKEFHGKYLYIERQGEEDIDISIERATLRWHIDGLAYDPVRDHVVHTFEVDGSGIV